MSNKQLIDNIVQEMAEKNERMTDGRYKEIIDLVAGIRECQREENSEVSMSEDEMHAMIIQQHWDYGIEEETEATSLELKNRTDRSIKRLMPYLWQNVMYELRAFTDESQPNKINHLLKENPTKFQKLHFGVPKYMIIYVCENITYNFILPFDLIEDDEKESFLREITVSYLRNIPTVLRNEDWKENKITVGGVCDLRNISFSDAQTVELDYNNRSLIRGSLEHPLMAGFGALIHLVQARINAGLPILEDGSSSSDSEVSMSEDELEENLNNDSQHP